MPKVYKSLHHARKTQKKLLEKIKETIKDEIGFELGQGDILGTDTWENRGHIILLDPEVKFGIELICNLDVRLSNFSIPSGWIMRMARKHKEIVAIDISTSPLDEKVHFAVIHLYTVVEEKSVEDAESI